MRLGDAEIVMCLLAAVLACAHARVPEEAMTTT
jgi:hypothetical protein